MADVVLEPAQRQAPGADKAPVKIGVLQSAAVKDQTGALFGELGNDPLGGDAEHGAGARNVHALTGAENARAEHRLHRVARARTDRGALGKTRARGHLFAHAAHDVQGLENAGHVLFVNAEDFELLVGPFLFLDLVPQAPARHGAPVDEGVFPLKARKVHENVGGVVHELDALLAEGFAVGDEPAREHRREHAVGLRVAGFSAPDVEVERVDRIDVFLRAAVEVIDIGGDGFTVFVHAADAADDAVAHNGGDVRGRVPLALDVLDRLFHAFDGDVEELVAVHLHPAGLGIVQRGGKRVRGNETELLVVDGNLDGLRARIKSHVKLSHA